MASEERYFIGTCGYSDAGLPPEGWSGVFYPKGDRRRVDGLEFSAAHFNCVEINSTFYRLASAAMARSWLATTPHARGQAVANALMLKSALGLDAGAAPPDSLAKAFPALADFIDRPGDR